MIEKSYMNWTAKVLVRHIDRNDINFDYAMQRGHVWDNDRKSLLIHSMIEGYPIPAFYMSKTESGVYDALDGKQRSDAIYKFINNEFSITESVPPVSDEHDELVDITGLTFENMPEWMQDRIKDYSLTIYYFENLQMEQVNEIFYRLNNGKALSAIELTRVKTKALDVFQEIAAHPMIDACCTENGKAKFQNEMMAMQIYSILYNESPDFRTKAFRPEMMETTVTNEQKSEVFAILDVLYDAHKGFDEGEDTQKIARKMRYRTHLVSLAYFTKVYKETHDTFDAIDFMRHIKHFFSTTNRNVSIDSAYNAASRAALAKPESIEARKAAMRRLNEAAL